METLDPLDPFDPRAPATATPAALPVTPAHPVRAWLRRWSYRAVLAVAPLWALVRVAGLETNVLARTPATQVLAFTPYAALLSLVPLAVTGIRREPKAVSVALAASITLGACVLPRAFGSAVGAARPGGPRLSVMTTNLSLGNADASAVVALVRTKHPDIVLLQEFTPEAEAAFDQAGIGSLLPYRTTHPSALAAGSAIFSRFPLQDPGFRKNWGGFYQVHATVSLPGAMPVLLESVHTCSPFSLGQLHCWRTDVAREPSATDAPPDTLRILAGDFNATLDHAPLRTLLGHGYRDVADTLGEGLTGTWGPYGRHPFIPPVTLDHVLAATPIGVESIHVYGVPRTDHRAVLAKLVLPPPIR
ncbi:MAG: endonuclease/exonuclease/phosphatase family protein [Catenulispora sp.]|nr:endonuclease/exonuclease/phosphatase family protein [Catenulispora sp.]